MQPVVNHDTILDAWRAAFLSDWPEARLKRYFSDQLRLIKEGEEGALLIEKLRKSYPGYFDMSAQPTIAWYKVFLANCSHDDQAAKHTLMKLTIKTPYAQVIVGYLDEVANLRPGYLLNYHSALYYQRFVAAVAKQPILTAPDLIKLLVSHDFNHLAILSTFQTVTRQSASTTDYYQQLLIQKAHIAALPVRREAAYDPVWPSLLQMLTEWLTEEIRLKERSNPAPMSTEKLTLDVPLSHLAFFIRLFIEGGHGAPQDNLSALFRFISRHISTKRQSAISPRGLSKEYYSVNQQTAARVRDILQRMIARINQSFFPAIAGFGIALIRFF